MCLAGIGEEMEEMSNPDIKRFWKFINAPNGQSAFDYYNEDVYFTKDAQAFIDRVKGMAREFQSMHSKKCDCFYCKFAREILNNQKKVVKK
jgi:hypothetical protein